MANYTSSANAALAFEEEGSPTETWTDKGLEAQVRLRCLWANRYTVLDDIINNSRPYPNVTYGGIYLSYALSGAVEGRGKNELAVAGEQSSSYDHAIVTINYMPVSDAGPTGGSPPILYSESIEPSAEFLTVSPEGLTWDDAGTEGLKEREAPGLLISTFDYIQVQYRVTKIPIQVLDHVGHINVKKVTAKLVGLTFPKETLLYNPPSLSRSINSQGSSVWTVSSRFSYRPNTWNKFWRPKEEAWSNIYKDAGPAGRTKYETYPTADFTKVLV